MLINVVRAEPAQISEAELQAALKKEIDRVMPISNEFEISLSNLKVPITKESSEDEVLIQDLSFNQGSYRFSAKVTTMANAQKQKSGMIKGQINLLLDVPIVTRIINSGEEITEADISWQKMPANMANSSVIQNKDELIGKTPKSMALNPGIAIRKSDVKSPVLVKRNESVLIIYKDEGIAISTVGQAKQDGIRGETIRFSIPNSKKEIQAIVKTKGQAEILVVG